MTNYIPSMMSLRAFEATARHLSFTRAARELNLTQTAVSHQIRKLEDLLGIKLFVRERGSIRLTEAAHVYVESVQSLIMNISEATALVMQRKRDCFLHVGSMATFAVKCLIPQLNDFRSLHPGISLRLGTVVSSETLKRRDYDIAIRYGSGDWPGFVTWKICNEEVFPICSAALLKSTPRLRTPGDLKHQTAIRTAFSFILRDEWPLWLEHAGIPDLEFANEITCDLLFPAVEAAIHGLGVALGRTPLVLPDLASGRLVEPFSTRLESKAAYFLSSPKESAQLSHVQYFKDWVLRTFGSPEAASSARSSGAGKAKLSAPTPALAAGLYSRDRANQV